MRVNRAELPIKHFESAAAWRSWLETNHSRSAGVWLRIFKKGASGLSVNYAGALDEALCFGWIDGQKKAYNPESFLQKFTPRRPKSMWSKRNRDHVTRLIKAKRMTAAGRTQVDAAIQDGRWDDAYDSPKTMTVPKDFLREVKKNKKAYAFFLTLKKADTYAISWRLRTAKRAETRAKRLHTLLEMMRTGKKLH